MRPRDLDRLSATAYDVLVIGGGVHGLAVAYEAASRGLQTALIDAQDFGSGASFNHQKTVHGGLRSLQSGRLVHARQAIRERRAFARIAPWLLRPLPFLVGTYRSVARNRAVLRAGFKVDTWLGRDRNEGIEPELHLPAARLISKAATLRLFPGIRQEKLTGGAQWYDYQMVEADRLTFAFAAAADRAGADLFNYVEALDPLREGRRVTGMRAADRLGGGEVSILARATINAAGSRAGELMTRFGIQREFPLIKAVNLVTVKRASDIALAAPSRGGRMLTLVPWRGRALIGTGQSDGLVQPADTTVGAAERDRFVADANAAFPALQLSTADVALIHRGIVPAVVGRDGRPDLRSEPAILDHAAGAEGAFTVIGVKYTTARAVAERTIAVVARRLKARLPASRTASTVLPGAGIADHEALAIERARDLALDVSLTTIRHLIGRYAERAADIITLLKERPSLGAALGPDQPTLAAEIVYVIQQESAVRLSDMVVRRTGLGAAGHPGATAVRSAAAIAAGELGWNEARLAEEIQTVEQLYAVTEP